MNFPLTEVNASHCVRDGWLVTDVPMVCENLDIDDFGDWVLLMTIISNAELPEPKRSGRQTRWTQARWSELRRFLRGEGQKSD
jgi:hypothetical protein